MGAHAFGRNSGKKTEMMINFFAAEKKRLPMTDDGCADDARSNAPAPNKQCVMQKLLEILN